MNYKNREVQPELFCSPRKKQKQSVFQKNSFQDHYRSAIPVPVDTLIVIVIAGLMITLSAFVAGLERGKVIVRAELRGTQEVIVSPAKPRKTTVATKNAPIEKTETLEILPKTKSLKTEKPLESLQKGYIIQLVTYRSDRYANEEVRRMKDSGISGYVLKSGEYYVVYSGTYSSKIKANEKLDNFKKRYKDCFVRLLKKS